MPDFMQENGQVGVGSGCEFVSVEGRYLGKYPPGN